MSAEGLGCRGSGHGSGEEPFCRRGCCVCPEHGALGPRRHCRDHSPPAAGPPVGMSSDTHDNEVGSTVWLTAWRGSTMCQWAMSPAGLGGAQWEPRWAQVSWGGLCGPCRTVVSHGVQWGCRRARAEEGHGPAPGGGVGCRARARLRCRWSKARPAGREYSCMPSTWPSVESPQHIQEIASHVVFLLSGI